MRQKKETTVMGVFNTLVGELLAKAGGETFVNEFVATVSSDFDENAKNVYVSRLKERLNKCLKSKKAANRNGKH